MLVFLFLLAILFFIVGMSRAPQNKKEYADRETATLEKKHHPEAVKPEPSTQVVTPPYVWVSLLLAVVGFNLFAYQTNVGIGLSFFNALLLLATLITFPRSKMNVTAIVLTLVGVFAGIGFAFRANGFVQAVDMIVMIFCFSSLILLRSYDRWIWRMVWFFQQAIKAPLYFIVHTFTLVAHITASKNDVNKKVSAFQVIKTGIITLLLLLFFIGLLTAADPIFAHYVTQFWNEAVGRLITSCIVVAVFSIFWTLKIHSKEEKEWTFGFLSNQDVFVSIAAIVVLFAIFLFIQARYLFGGKADISVVNLTYSDYVRKGFAELLIASFFGSLLAYLLILKSRLTDAVHRIQQMQVLNAALIIELFCLLAAALKRDLEYVNAYGLTRMRLVGEVFLIWLAVVLFLLFVLTFMRKLSEKYLVIGIFGASVLTVLFFNFANIDQMVVDTTPKHHNFTDYFYIDNLSEDALDGWRQSVPAIQANFDAMKTKTQLDDVEKAHLANMKLALMSIQQRRKKLEQKYFPDDKKLSQKYFAGFTDPSLPSDWKWNRTWQARNISEEAAYAEFSSHPEIYETQVDNLVKEIVAYQETNNIDLYQQENRQLNDLEYLLVSVHLDYFPRTLEELRALPPTPTP